MKDIIRRILTEVRVPRSERVELYKDENIIVVVPLTHRALQKYAHQCQWCINSDLGEWEDYHKGKHAVIIQRNPKKPKMGITGNPTASEIFLLAKWDNNQSDFDDVCHMLDYEFRNDRTMSNYYDTISNDINNFATDIVYYSPENGIYDQEDNFLWNYNYEISDIPNVTPEVIQIMDDYLQENEEMSLQESIRKVFKDEYEREYILYRAVGLDEAKKSCEAGHLVYYSRDPMSRDWEVIEYGLGDAASEMSDEEVDEYVNNIVPWKRNRKGVNLTSDLDNAKGYSDIVLVINLVGYDYAEFSDVHIFAKNPDDCKIKSVYYNGEEYSKEDFLDITKSLQESIKKVLKEEVTNKQLILLNNINNNGVLMTSKLLGGFAHLKRELKGVDWMTREVMVKTIIDVCKEKGGFSMNELGLEEIKLDESNGLLRNLSFIDKNGIEIVTYEKDDDGNYDEEPSDWLSFNYDSKFRNGNYVLDTIHLYEIFDAVIDTYTNYDKFLYR